MRLLNGPRDVSTPGNGANQYLGLACPQFGSFSYGDHRPSVFMPLLQYVVAVLLFANGCCEQYCKAGSECFKRFASTGMIFLPVPRHVQVNSFRSHFPINDIAQEYGSKFFSGVQRHLHPNAAFLPLWVNVDGFCDFRLQFEIAILLHDLCVCQTARCRGVNPFLRRQWRVARDDPACKH